MSAIAPAFINAAAIFPQIGASIRQCSSPGQRSQWPNRGKNRRPFRADGELSAAIDQEEGKRMNRGEGRGRSSSRREGGGDRWGLRWWCATTAGVWGQPLPPGLVSPTWQLRGAANCGAAAFCQCGHAMPMPFLARQRHGRGPLRCAALPPIHHPMCARVSGGVCASAP